MGGHELVTNVNVDNAWFGPAYPDAVVTDDVARQIVNPKAWPDGILPDLAPVTVAKGSDQPPPLHGAGSGTDAWLEYGRSRGLVLDDDARKVDIVDALKGAGKLDVQV